MNLALLPTKPLQIVADWKEHKCFDVEGMLMTFNTEATVISFTNQKCRNKAQRNTNRNVKRNNYICTIKNETEKYKKDSYSNVY